jgi:hypothetical protein
MIKLLMSRNLEGNGTGHTEIRTGYLPGRTEEKHKNNPVWLSDISVEIRTEKRPEYNRHRID